MNTIYANHNNLASVLMGKNIQFPWRGQPNVIIRVPYSEWLEFVKDYRALLRYRRPLDYKRMLQSADEGIKVRYFMYDISWALYSELACSSNTNNDATVILPDFDDGKNISISEALNVVAQFDKDTLDHYHNSLKAITRNYYNISDSMVDLQFGLVNLSTLSEWNTLIFSLCIYLQSKSSNTTATEKLNIDWR